MSRPNTRRACSRNPTASVANEGHITVAEGGLAAFVAPIMAVFDRALPVFQKLGKTITLIGGSGVDRRPSSRIP